jgi:hypothetical protein
VSKIIIERVINNIIVNGFREDTNQLSTLVDINMPADMERPIPYLYDFTKQNSHPNIKKINPTKPVSNHTVK